MRFGKGLRHALPAVARSCGARQAPAGTAHPIWLLEACNVFMQIGSVLCDQRGTRRRDPVVCPRFHADRRRRRVQQLLQRDAAVRNHRVPNALHLHYRLAHHRRYLVAGLPLHSLHGRVARAAQCARTQWRAPHVPNAQAQQHPAAVDLDYHRAILAGARRHALHAVGRVRVRRDVQPRPRGRHRRRAGVLVKWLFHEHARLRRRAPHVAPSRHAAEFFQW